MWYVEKGRGLPVIFVHCWLCCSESFEKTVDQLGQRYHAIAFDLLGHGRSDRPEDTPYALLTLAITLHFTINDLIGEEKFTLVGHDMGGKISAIYTASPQYGKQIKGLVLMSTSPSAGHLFLDLLYPSIGKLERGELRLTDRKLMEPLLVSLFFSPQYVENNRDVVSGFVERAMTNTHEVALQTMFCCAESNIEDQFGRIDVPTLILSGDRDASVPPELSEQLHALIRNSEVAVLSPNVGHALQLEAHEQLSSKLSDFLEKLS